MIEAVQWFKDGDHPEVQSRAPMIIFDVAENYFYVQRCDHEVQKSRGWLAVDPEGFVAQNHGDYLPFAFYEIKSGRHLTLAEHPDLVRRYAEHEGFETDPIAMGYIKTLEGGHMVAPGDWIIKGVNGEFYPCKPDIFEATYEAVK